MGFNPTRTFDFTSYAATASTYAAKGSASAAFVSRSIDPLLDPSKFMLRESRNSAANPKSTPIILAFDVTGSMGKIPFEMVKSGLGVLVKEIIDRNPVSDPHIMIQAIGDAWCDRAPLQVSQFETDIKMVEQFEKIFVEGGGGGNHFESYNLPWHFAAYHTSCDAFEKDGRKGYLFTMGDEEVPKDLRAEDLEKVYGRSQEPCVSNAELLKALSTKYHVFHLMIEQGSHMQYETDAVVKGWTELLGQRAIRVSDYTKISEIVISAIQMVEGVDKDVIIKSWSGDTSLVVQRAIGGLTAEPANSKTGLVRF